MPISKESYEELKEYWDYQRKVEYNRELVFKMAEKLQVKAVHEIGPMSIQEVRDYLWSKVEQNEYEDPIKGWIPEDDNYKFEWELKQLPMVKGRPVVLRAKKGLNEVFDE